MTARIDLVGARFGAWLVLSYACGSRWLCRCSCGTVREVSGHCLRTGLSKSCGCISGSVGARARTHGLYQHPLYKTWEGMIARCTNPKHGSYPDYGGRGIRVCDRWLDVRIFVFDIESSIGRRPSHSHTIDRIDNEGHYEPGNVQWSTTIEQSGNRRSTFHVTAFGRTQCVAAWAREHGLSKATLRRRLADGWPAEQALTLRPDRSIPAARRLARIRDVIVVQRPAGKVTARRSDHKGSIRR